MMQEPLPRSCTCGRQHSREDPRIATGGLFTFGVASGFLVVCVHCRSVYACTGEEWDSLPKAPGP